MLLPTASSRSRSQRSESPREIAARRRRISPIACYQKPEKGTEQARLAEEQPKQAANPTHPFVSGLGSLIDFLYWLLPYLLIKLHSKRILLLEFWGDFGSPQGFFVPQTTCIGSSGV
jgi:hypothetical protein